MNLPGSINVNLTFSYIVLFLLNLILKYISDIFKYRILIIKATHCLKPLFVIYVHLLQLTILKS